MLKLIGLMAVTYILFATGLAQVVLLTAANILMIGASI